MITLSRSETDFQTVALAHARAYCDMRAQDYAKLAYQHAHGCEHMVRVSDEVVRYIESERLRGDTGVRFEPIGGGLVRAHLSGNDASFSSSLIARMFEYTARIFRPRESAMEEALSVLSGLSDSGKLTVSSGEFRAFLSSYRAAGCPAVHHSEEFRRAYAPAYRVILDVFSRYSALFSALETLQAQKNGAIIAIDGMCASGKTSLARVIADVFGASLFHTDDFFLPPEKRTESRLHEIGGNFDRERFLSEVLLPLKAGKPFEYRPYSCRTSSYLPPVSASRASLNIVEGAYACHPALADSYDFSVVMLISPDLQISRIRARNGDDMLPRFRDEWIPMENRYLAKTEPVSRANLVYNHL